MSTAPRLGSRPAAKTFLETIQGAFMIYHVIFKKDKLAFDVPYTPKKNAGRSVPPCNSYL